jgi:hypothetical protein
MSSVSISAVGAQKKRPILLKASRHVSVVHRYLGIAVGCMFALWFATGSVLSFVPFPLLEDQARVASQDEIDVAAVNTTPTAALAHAGAASVDALKLISVAGEPRYVLSLSGRPVLAVDASTGEPVASVSSEQAAAVATAFAAQRAIAVDGPHEYDQWTVHDRYDAHRPYYKVTMDDASGTQLYVSARSGEVMQRTTRRERAWNRVGAVIHWLNPTALRKHDELWRGIMWTLALAGITLISMGAWLGIVRYLNLKRSGRPGLSPFTGWLRWHHTIGLFAAVIALNWIGSGWLSLDRGAFFSSGEPTRQQVEQLRGMTLDDASRAFARLDAAVLAGAREIEVTALGGRPLLIVRGDSPGTSRVVTADAAGGVASWSVIPDALLSAAIGSAWSPADVQSIDAIAADDAYRLRTTPWPVTTRRAVLNDAGKTWIQIDAASGRVVSVMDPSRRVYRWIVAGPHNLDFPIFNHADPVRRALILIATAIGFVFSSTGIVLAAKRVRRMLA